MPPSSTSGHGRGESSLARLFDHPFLQRRAYLLMVAAAVPLGIMLSVLEDAPLAIGEPVVVVSLAVLGLATIALSRAIAAGRETLPLFLQILAEGRWGVLDKGPGFFRFSGSCLMGLAAGRGGWAVCSIVLSDGASAVAGGVIGIAAALAIWVWTWFAFPEIED